MTLAIYANSYDTFNGGSEQQIECETCERYWEVDLDWDGESWIPRHNVMAGRDGFHCTTMVIRDRSEWQICPYCLHANHVETTGDPEEPLRFPKLPAPQSVCAVCRGDGLARYGEYAVTDDACVACDGTGVYVAGTIPSIRPARTPFERHIAAVTEAYGRAYREGVL